MSGWGPQVQNLDIEIIAHERPTIDCERRGKNELDDRPLGLPMVSGGVQYVPNRVYVHLESGKSVS